MPRRVHVQRGFLAVILVLAALLVLSAASSFVAARRMTTTLLQGEGEALWHNMREQLPRGRPPLPEELADLLARNHDVGLRHISMRGPADEIEASVGDLTSPVADIRVTLTPDGRAVMRRPLHHGPTPGRAGPPGPPEPARAGPPEPGRQRNIPPASIVLEFEPQIAAAVTGRARRDLIVSLAVAAALLVSAGVAHRLQRRARIAEASLLERRHLAVLGEMSAVLAHEIRNPLASLKGHAQLLEEQLAGDDRRQAKARRIVDEAVRLERLTTSLLDFVRAGQVARTRSDPRALARRALEMTDASRVTLDDRTAPDTWSLDPTRIEQALVNLVRNALQASDGQVELGVRREAGGLVFLVADRGPGIPPGLRDRLFQPFATGRTQGTGLGLAVVRRVAELHGGTIAAVSRTGGGASFRLWLPPGPETIPPPLAIDPS